jgi:site-specific recombinase XerD
MLSLWRRHESKCPYARKGRACIKCDCPIWCDGEIDGKRIRQSMDTRDWARATRKLASIEDPYYGLRPCIQPGCTELVKQGRCSRHLCELSRAITAYHEAHQDASEGTRRNRRRALSYFGAFAAERRIKTVHEIDLPILAAFRSAREISARTWSKELEILRHFFRFCLDNDWVLRNWAENVPMPKNLKPAPREPYTPNEVARIFAACDQMGRGAYERLRARAMVLLLRYTALRISDVATLEKNRVRGGEIFIRTTKNGKPVKLPIHPDLQRALDILPLPRGAQSTDCRYYFWSGEGGSRAMIRDATRTMATVYKASGVAGACSHRFRHTLATEILEMGGSIQEAADVLGDSEAIVRKHYAKWSAGRQARISQLLRNLWHVYGTRENAESEVVHNEWIRMVDGMGFEPTTPALRTPCSPS